jgi:hypothetical protein
LVLSALPKLGLRKSLPVRRGGSLASLLVPAIDSNSEAH